MKGALGGAVLAAVVAGSAAAQDLDEAARQFMRHCGTCHSVAPDETLRLGPHLRGVIDRPAGAVDDYDYSEAMRTAGVVWDVETLDLYMTNSQALLPGANMAVRVRVAEERAAILDYLLAHRE